MMMQMKTTLAEMHQTLKLFDNVAGRCVFKS